jgi:hypothetical protein
MRYVGEQFNLAVGQLWGHRLEPWLPAPQMAHLDQSITSKSFQAVLGGGQVLIP